MRADWIKVNPSSFELLLRELPDEAHRPYVLLWCRCWRTNGVIKEHTGIWHEMGLSRRKWARIRADLIERGFLVDVTQDGGRPAILVAVYNAAQFGRMPTPHWVKSQLIARDGKRCALCNTDSDICVDHILPVAAGGGNDLDNLRLLCRSCNSSRRENLQHRTNATRGNRGLQ